MKFGRPLANESAFTLVELMIVVVIVGILSSVMVVEMRGSYEDAVLRANARKIIDVCDAASNRAISVNQAQSLRIDAKSGKFVVRGKARALEEADSGAPEIPTAAGELDTRVSLEIREPKSDEETSDDEPKADMETVTFNPDGTADAREFLLRDRDGVEMVLRINPATGRVRIVELAPPE